MANPITAFNGTITPISGTYPYGQIKSDPRGTTIDVVSNGDLQQFFQRIMDNAGISPNSLPDNATNGFQLVQALNTLINQESAALAATCGATVGNYGVAVIVTGMVKTNVGSVYTITQGWCYYNGQFIYGNAATLTSGGGVLHAVISMEDGLPVLNWSYTGSPAGDATHFNFSLLTPHPLLTLTSEVALGAWTNLTVGTGWTATGGTPPQYMIDGVGRVYLRGSATAGAGATSTFVSGLLSAAQPTQQMNLPCYSTLSGVQTTVPLLISGTNIVVLVTTSGQTYALDGITYLNS